MYEYHATITKVYDGDTVTADIDLGFKTFRTDMKLRLYGINAPEMRGEEREQGIISRNWLREQILGKQVIIHTQKDKQGKYGRWLAEIFLPENINQSINRQLIEKGLAVTANY